VPTLFDRIDAYVNDRLALDPIEATVFGAREYDDQYPDLSPVGAEASANLDRRFLSEVAGIEPADDAEAVALAFVRERLGGRIAAYELGEHLRSLGAITSNIQDVRDVFPLMTYETDGDWRVVQRRLNAVPTALAQARGSLQVGIDAGLTAAQRQSRAVTRMCLITAGEESEANNAPSDWFADLVAGYDGDDAQLRADLVAAAAKARDAFAATGHWLEDVYTPAATPEDAVGIERYAVRAKYFTGADLDLLETYEWGWAELARLHERVDAVVQRIVPGGTTAQAIATLDTDPRYVIHGEAALLEYLQSIIDVTTEELAGTLFEIPEQMRRCEAAIAPPGGAAAQYYTSPSEDFTRPGRTWWPTLGKSEFVVWSALSTWYHEGVPGHHQQSAYTMLQRDRLSRLQRMNFISGHGEGWALYAERLMDELGKFSDPGYEMGYLMGQCLRAARVVVDIGLHLKLEIPAVAMANLPSGSVAGEVWHRDLALQFLIDRGLIDPDFAASEADRYLGWPGQAISYKLGERVWLEAREDARRRHGEAFDLMAWHTAALRLGPLGLDPFAELARTL